ncbi:MAG: transcription initiation factor IIB family protein [Halobacterium sp.]
MSQRTLTGDTSTSSTTIPHPSRTATPRPRRAIKPEGDLDSDERTPTASETERQHRRPDHCCPECATDEHLVVDETETFCQACGLVVARDILDRELQWETTTDGERQPARGGAPTTIRRHDKGLPTEIGSYRDGYGNELSSKTQRQFKRLRKWDDRAKASTTHDQSLRTGLGEIARLVSAAELPTPIHDRAARLFRDAWESNLLRGRSIEAIATASIFAACRLERLPRFLEELAAVARVGESDIKSAYRLLNREFELATPPPLPQDFLPRLANAVDAHPQVERRAHQLVTAPAVGVLANGRQPAGVAAACLYHAHDESELTNLKLTQQRLADAGFSTPTTIRNIRRELLSLNDAGDLPDPDGNLDDYFG